MIHKYFSMNNHKILIVISGFRDLWAFLSQVRQSTPMTSWVQYTSQLKIELDRHVKTDLWLELNGYSWSLWITWSQRLEQLSVMWQLQNSITVLDFTVIPLPFFVLSLRIHSRHLNNSQCGDWRTSGESMDSPTTFSAIHVGINEISNIYLISVDWLVHNKSCGLQVRLSIWAQKVWTLW